MTINADFCADLDKLFLIEIDCLKNMGFQFNANASEDDRIFQYFNLMHRIPTQKPREIKKSSSFFCPKSLERGLSILEDKIRKGESLFPHLSRKIVEATYLKDYLFYDFGLVHFHLGIEHIINNPLLMEGAKKIVYALLNDESCYLIRVDEHGMWNDIALLESLKKDYPEALKPWKILGKPLIILNNEKRRYLVKNNTNIPIQIGGEFYSSPGMGTTTAGTSLFATRKRISMYNYFKSTEIAIKEHIQQNLTKIEVGLNIKLNNMNLVLKNINPILIYDLNNELYINFDETNRIRISSGVIP